MRAHPIRRRREAGGRARVGAARGLACAAAVHVWMVIYHFTFCKSVYFSRF